jgi:hypothetical protein
MNHMGTPMSRLGMLFGAAAIVFAVTVALGLKILPEPHSETDYLVVGSVATFLSLGVLFAVLITTWIKTPEVFFKKPQAPDEEAGAGTDKTSGE